MCEIKPGREGGIFPLSFGGKIRVPKRTLKKRDVISCRMVSPLDRHLESPILRSDEFLLSEVYILAISGSVPLQRPVVLKLPFEPQDKTPHHTTCVWVKPQASESWRVIRLKTSTYKQEDGLAEVYTRSGGAFIVVSQPVKEYFLAPSVGRLHTLKMDHNISLRIPRKAFDVNTECFMQINESEFPKLEQRLSWELRGLTAVSMEYVFGPKIEKPENQRFYRPVTIKLPLPSISLDHVTEDGDVMRPEMIVMRFDEQDGGWRMNESRLKFDRATVSFETYNFAKFCVALVRPGSISRLPGMFDLVDKSSSRLTSGEILPFVRFEAGRWTVCVDFASTANLESVKSGRVEQGYREIQPAKSTLPQQLQGRMDRLEWMAANFFTNKKDVEMSNGDLLTVQVSGDVEMCEDGSASVGIRFHAKLKENCRTLDIRPKGKIGDVGQLENGNKSLLGVVKVSYVPHRGTTSVWYRLFVFEIKPVTVKSYWGLDTTEDASEATAAPSPGVPRRSLWSLVKFDMAKEKQAAVRDPAVLKRSSLQWLSRHLKGPNDAASLIQSLQIPEVPIKTMLFDIRASGQDPSDITYRALLMWRRLTANSPNQVTLLINALGEAGRTDLSMIVFQKHAENSELGP